MSKFFYYISISSIFLAIGLLAWFIFTLVYPYKIVDITNIPYPVENTIVHKGENLIYNVNFCKYDNSRVIVSQTLVGTQFYSLPVYEADIPKGCYVIQNSKTIIPYELPVGEYRLVTVASYEKFPWRSVRYSSETEPFIVTD